MENPYYVDTSAAERQSKIRQLEDAAAKLIAELHKTDSSQRIDEINERLAQIDIELRNLWQRGDKRRGM